MCGIEFKKKNIVLQSHCAVFFFFSILTCKWNVNSYVACVSDSRLAHMVFSVCTQLYMYVYYIDVLTKTLHVLCTKYANLKAYILINY